MGTGKNECRNSETAVVCVLVFSDDARGLSFLGPFLVSFWVCFSVCVSVKI